MRRTNPKETERKRILSDDEIRAVWNAATGSYGRLVRFLLLTAQRREKVASMQWSDLAGNVWTIRTEEREKGNAGELVLPERLWPWRPTGARVSSFRVAWQTN